MRAIRPGPAVLRLLPRFSLRTLMLGLALLSAAVAFCVHWEPWVSYRAFNLPTPPADSVTGDSRLAVTVYAVEFWALHENKLKAEIVHDDDRGGLARFAVVWDLPSGAWRYSTPFKGARPSSHSARAWCWIDSSTRVRNPGGRVVEIQRRDRAAALLNAYRLPEFPLYTILAIALGWSFWRDLRTFRRQEDPGISSCGTPP